MKDVEKTVRSVIDKQRVTFIDSLDFEGFPNVKAMLQPRKREGITKPDYYVLKFTAISGRFYNNFSSEEFIIE